MSFFWGVATSAHQIEGNNCHNDWWQWELEGNIEGGVVSGLAADHWNRFKQDLELAKSLGLNSYRFSVEWSRIEPEEGKWDIEALEWYSNLIAECERLGLAPMVTLHHFTLPQWLAERGGFTWEHSPGRFAGFIKKVVAALGARVPLWCTLNEPNALMVGQYVGCFNPPAQYDTALLAAATRNLFRAHVLAYDLLHSLIQNRQGPWKAHPLQVGIAFNLIDMEPFRKWHPLEQAAARAVHRYYNMGWPDAVMGKKQHFGVPGFLPYSAQLPQARGRKTVDFLGVNYYTKLYVLCRPFASESAFPASTNSFLGFSFSRGRDLCSDLGWVLHPKGLARVLRTLKAFQLPIYITENGIADSTDRLRPAFMIAHLKEVARAIADGVDVRGYYHWSLIDNFEWMKGFWPRFGLYEVDYTTFERKKRPSASLYSKIIQSHAGSPPREAILATLSAPG